MKNLIFIIFVFIFGGCASKERSKIDQRQQLSIIELPALSWTDTLKSDSGVRIAKFDYFLVRCEGFDSSEIRVGIDEYAKEFKQKYTHPYAQYNMLYFNETSQTNEKNLASDKDLIDTYSTKHDLIFEYLWSYGELISVEKYSEGIIVYPKTTIKLEDVNGSKR